MLTCPMCTLVTFGILAAGLAIGAASAADALPDALRLQSGAPVASAADWPARRLELLELFRHEVFGRLPAACPLRLPQSVTRTAAMMDGAADRRLVHLAYAGPGGSGAITLIVFVPATHAGPVPCFLLICNRPPSNIDPDRTQKSPFWPAERIVARGCAAAAFFVGDVAPDRADGPRAGALGAFAAPGEQPADDAWATIAAWAWGASRCIDYLVTDADIDARRIAVVGHSRGGKTALWCGAQDERVALTVSNDSGCTGAAISRSKQGETIALINRSFPHWFCADYKRWGNREAEMPFDQHELLALCAPRLLYVASATEDLWSDPGAEFRACVAASPAWSLFHLPGIGADRQPPPDQPLHAGGIGYHLRTGKHDLTEYDWSCYLDFGLQHWRRDPTGSPADGPGR